MRYLKASLWLVSCLEDYTAQVQYTCHLTFLFIPRPKQTILSDWLAEHVQFSSLTYVLYRDTSLSLPVKQIQLSALLPCLSVLPTFHLAVFLFIYLHLNLMQFFLIHLFSLHIYSLVSPLVSASTAAASHYPSLCFSVLWLHWDTRHSVAHFSLPTCSCKCMYCI